MTQLLFLQQKRMNFVEYYGYSEFCMRYEIQKCQLLPYVYSFYEQEYTKDQCINEILFILTNNHETWT